MTQPLLDPGFPGEDARAGLLCYLVVGQLVAQARTGEWLRTDHLVEATRTWLAANGAAVHWLERLTIGTLSAKVARHFQLTPDFADLRFLAELLTDGWRLDYRSPVVRQVYGACVDELGRTG